MKWRSTLFLVVFLVMVFDFSSEIPVRLSWNHGVRTAIAGTKEVSDTYCARAVNLLEKQNKMLSRDLRQIKRELLLLKAELSRPGIKEVFAGIGYIFGIFGVAAYMKARAMNKQNRES
ncbi:MAG: hypothetical protein JRI45_04320 [Deltaproteobacteria bacterium]|nr:hypothetical protein [Deltaproteobacteria bacterium]MBW2069118.1 hypothetical protein [Deltaproteobacteria bacterium]